MQIHATPLALDDSPISRLIRQMAHVRYAGRQEAPAKKKKAFSVVLWHEAG